MKKTILLLIFIFCSLLIQAQYVSLKGRQFKDENGNDFYPFTTAYVFDIIHPMQTPTEADDYFLSRARHFGPSDGGQCGIAQCLEYESFTEATCSTEIQNDLNIIHDQMGFNTIRIAGLSPDFELTTNQPLNPVCPINPNNLTLKASWAPPTTCWTWQGCFIDISITDYQDRYFEFVRQMLTFANNASLKVIMDLGGSVSTNNADNGSAVDHFSVYLNFLSDLGTYISSLPLNLRQTLLAYVITSEPQYSGQYGNKKYIVCDKVNQMSARLRSVDPGHLITVGSTDVTDILEWDPAVMNIDFISPHLYPHYNRDYETNADAAVERVKNQIYWFSKNSPMPWMMGETGFSAIDDDLTSGCSSPVSLSYPAVHGGLTAQKNYAHDIIKMTRDCNGSGFFWWMFQEVEWGNGAVPDLRENGYGLLRHGEAFTDYSTMKKPVVDEFDSYLNGIEQPPAMDLNGCAIPASYYDPYNTRNVSDYYFGTNTIPSVTGTVTFTDNINVAHSNIKIKDAVVKAHSFMRYALPNQPTWPIDNIAYTFTHDDGTYSITPFDPDDLTNSSSQYIRWLEVSALGASCQKEKDWGWNGQGPPLWLPPPPIVNTNFSLFKINTNTSDNLSGVLTVTTTGNIYKAFSTLTVSNNVTFSSGSSADLYALDEVHVETAFHAANGSEVHLFNTQVLADCQEILYATPSPHNGFRIGSNQQPDNLFLELSFRKVGEMVKVYPNPGAGIFNIAYYANGSVLKNVKVFDMVGNLVYHNAFTNNLFVMDLSNLTKGVYSIRIDDQSNVYNHKIIIQ